MENNLGFPATEGMWDYLRQPLLIALSSKKWHLKCCFTERRTYWDRNSPASPSAIPLARPGGPREKSHLGKHQ